MFPIYKLMVGIGQLDYLYLWVCWGNYIVFMLQKITHQRQYTKQVGDCSLNNEELLVVFVCCDSAVPPIFIGVTPRGDETKNKIILSTSYHSATGYAVVSFCATLRYPNRITKTYPDAIFIYERVNLATHDKWLSKTTFRNLPKTGKKQNWKGKRKRSNKIIHTIKSLKVSKKSSHPNKSGHYENSGRQDKFYVGGGVFFLMKLFS